MRAIALAVIAVLVLAVAAPALAQEEGGDGTGGETTTTIDSGGAAVPQPVPDEGNTEDPWTARFLPATIVALTVLVIGGAFSYYFFRIRGRYDVVSG